MTPNEKNENDPELLDPTLLNSATLDSASEIDPMELDETADLETVLGAWHDATVRLERTHEALRTEVQRLSDELEIKNRELARQNRLADLGQMASHVAHEVRNNLVPVTLYMSMLKRRVANDLGTLDVVHKVESGLGALDVTVNDLLHFTSDREPLLSDVPIDVLACDICESLLPQFDAQQIEAVVDVPDGLIVMADRDMLRRAILNLVLNALDVMPDGGQLEIIAECGPDSSVMITVSDTGDGFSDDALQRAFEPFYSTKHNGTGLGLAIVLQVAETHHGSLLIANRKQGGAAMTLVLPNQRG